MEGIRDGPAQVREIFVPTRGSVVGREVGLQQLLRVLPNLTCMRAQREPEANEVGLRSCEQA